MKPNEQVFIGVAKSGDLALSNDPYSVGSAIRLPGAAAICAVQALADGYRILAFRTISYDGMDEAVKALRRELAQLVTAKAERVVVGGEAIMLPGHDPSPAGAANNSREWREAVAKREAQQEQAAAAREAELDRVGATFAVKADGDNINLPRLANLLKAGKFMAVNSSERAPLFWLRAALDGAQPIGCFGVALARAIQAADAGARGGLRA